MEHPAPQVIIFDSRIYSKSAILRACHYLTGQMDLALEANEHGDWLVRVGPLSTTMNADQMVRQAVVDFATRELIEEKTKEIRTTLIQVALLEASPKPRDTHRA